MGDKGSFILKMKEFMQKVATFFKTPMMRSVLNIRTVYFLLLPLILLLALSVMHLTNGNAAYMFFASPFWGLKFLISYLFLLAFQCFFWCITQHGAIAATLNNLVFFVLALITEMRIAFRGDPLLPTDVLMVGELGSIAGFIEIPFMWAPVISGVLLLGATVLYFILRRKTVCEKRNLQVRIACVVLSLTFFGVTAYNLCFSVPFRHDTLAKMDVQIAAFNPVDDYRSNGLVLEFFPRIGDLVVSRMEGYDEQKIEEIRQNSAQQTYFKEGDVHPNIIFIQNEALWDVYEMNGETAFSVDPLANMRQISMQDNARMGKMATSVFGGGTCLPEFEAITGMNCAYLPSNGYPYVQYITRKTPSIVSHYKDCGYETIAFHPYQKNFYSRDRAYPLLGFDSYCGREEMANPTVSGWYVSDQAVTDYIIDAHKNKTKDRMFMFTVTMQNHGGYTPSRYEHYDVEVKNDKLSAEDLSALADYTQGVYEADVAFKNLATYFSTVEEPTIILMYGDHLPLLGTEGSIYRACGYVEDQLPFVTVRYEQLHETPYIVWANYDVDLSGFSEKMSAGKLGLELLRMSELPEVPWYFNTMYALYEKMPVVNPHFYYDAKGNKYVQMPEVYLQKEADFKYIQYDILHGRQFSAKK